MEDQIAITLRKALDKLTSQKAQLDGQVAAIEAALDALGGGAPRAKEAKEAKEVRTRKGMSPAARKAIGKRMKAYWAKRRADAAKGKPKASK